MKPRYLIIVGAIMIVVAVILINVIKKTEASLAPAAPAAPAPTLTTVTDDGMKLTTNTDPTDVFQKAFWRHPTNDDQILHAERREWSVEDGVQQWQWFIAVRPGSELLVWLETNPFFMALSNSVDAVENPPAWFPESSDDFKIMKNTEGRFMIMLSSDQKLLYATDAGHGFTTTSVNGAGLAF